MSTNDKELHIFLREAQSGHKKITVYTYWIMFTFLVTRQLSEKTINVRRQWLVRCQAPYSPFPRSYEEKKIERKAATRSIQYFSEVWKLPLALKAIGV
jgi:hypothetical protein